MRIEIVCKNEIFCDLMKARVEHALEELDWKAEVEYVMDHPSQDALETDSNAGLVIDGELFAIGTGHTIEDIRRLIESRSDTAQ